MSRQQELTDKVLPWIASSGRLGSEVQFVECATDSSSSGEAQFASSVCFVTAAFKSGKEKEFALPLVIKYNVDNEAVRNWLKLDPQFRNEVVVYERALPFLDKDNIISEIFPRYFYGSAKLGEDPNGYIIVIEDLRSSGFKLSPEILDLDFAHCALAFRKLGAFHALSFAAKRSNLEGLLDVAKHLEETKLFEDNREDGDYLYGGSVGRAAAPLLKREEKVGEIQRFISNLKDTITYFKTLLSVQEPMGVICHGDFCRNNVLYKYENGEPTDIRFFDLATARYGSPMLDFSFFFFLNCSEDSRKLYREEYLKIYHDSLSSAIPEINIPPLEEFQEEFRRKAVYGFLLCSFFKPAMMDPVPFNPVEEVQRSVEEKADRMSKTGGEKATQVTSNMLRELIDFHCVL